MKWEETSTVRDFHTFRYGDLVMTIFHGLHEDLFNVIVEEEDHVTRNFQIDANDLKRLYGVEL